MGTNVYFLMQVHELDLRTRLEPILIVHTIIQIIMHQIWRFRIDKSSAYMQGRSII